MSDQERIARLNGVVHGFRSRYCEYPLLETIKDEMRMLVGRDNAASEGGVMALIGVSGSGKTQLINSFVRDYPRERHAIRHADGRVADRATVVVVSMPDAGVKSVVQATYEALAQAEAPRETRFDIEGAICHYAVEQETRLIIFEEGHEAAIDDTNKTVQAVARLLKRFSNKAAFSVLIVGTEEARRLLTSNKELKRRSLGTHAITPLDWNVEADRRWFCTLLRTWDKLLEEAFERSGLGDPGMAAKIHAACGGVIGLAAMLVERAGLTAVRDRVRNGGRNITEAHLHAAHRLLEMDTPNPFEPAGGEKADTDARGAGAAPAPEGGDARDGAPGRGGRNAARDRNFRP